MQNTLMNTGDDHQSTSQTQTIKYNIQELFQIFQSEEEPNTRKIIATRLAYICLMNLQQPSIVIKCLEYIIQHSSQLHDLSSSLEIVNLSQFAQLFPKQHRLYKVQVTSKLRDYYLSNSKIRAFRQCNKYLISELQILIKRSLEKQCSRNVLCFYAKQLVHSSELMLYGQSKNSKVQESTKIQQLIKLIEQMPSQLAIELQEQLMKLYYKQGQVYEKLKYKISAQRSYQVSLNIAKRIKSNLQTTISQKLMKLKLDKQ